MYSSNSHMISISRTNQLAREYQIYFFLATCIISIQLICNTIEPIIFTTGWFSIPASAIFYVLSFAISDIITENFGFNLAVHAVIFNIFAQITYCGIAAVVSSMTQINGIFHAGVSIHHTFHFLTLELISSTLSILVSMIANDYILNRLKFIFLGKGFWWRTIFSTAIGEIVMLNIDYNITFYGTKSFFQIEHLILNAMAYKVIAAFVLAVPADQISRFIAKRIFILTPANHSSRGLFSEIKNAIFFK